MASSSHQQDNDHFQSKSNSPCFFKMILHDTIKNGRLGFPRKFVQIYGNGMSSSAMLRVPSGAVWKVELTKCDGKIWLEKGWLEFSNHYSLEFGHFLVFRYDGNSNFHVLIFDRSASEIQYPLTSNDHTRSNEIEDNIDESEDSDSIKILENSSLSRKMNEKLQSPCPTAPTMMKSTNAAINGETECIGKPGFLAQNIRHNGCPAINSDKITRPNTIQQREKATVLERVYNDFKSENPFFLIVMQPSCVGLGCGKKYSLAIPRNFAKKHLMKEHSSVILCNSNGKTWIATLKRRDRRNTVNSYLQTGWATFVQDNNIEVGDVCAFDLINSMEISFKVVIYKGQHANDLYASRCRLEPLSALEKAKAYQMASVFKSENPFFVIVIQPSYVNKCRLNIPTNFARQYLLKMNRDVIFLLSNGKAWPVTFYQHVSEKLNGTFSKGWRKFAWDNNLEVGDACAFELIEGAETSMKVTIYKKLPVHVAKLSSSVDDTSKGKQVQHHEGLVIKTEESTRTKEKGRGDYSGDALEEASQGYPSLQQNETIQDTNWSEPTRLIHRIEWF